MKSILLAATALLLCSGSLYAQTSTSGATVQVGSQSGSNSTANSSSNPSITGMSVGNGTSASNSSATTNSLSRSGSSASASPTMTTDIIINTGANSGNSGSSRKTGAHSGSGSQAAGSGGVGAGQGHGSHTLGTLRTSRSAASGSAASPASGSAASPASGTTGAATDPTAIPTTGIQYSGGTTTTLNGTTTIKNTPEVIAPGIVGGNPCSIGVSGGVGLPGLGITGGATWADKGCERRQVAALLWNIEQHAAAIEVMCKDDNVRDAMKITGTPCVADRPVQPVAAVAAPAPVAALSVSPAAAPAARKLPDWCATISPREWNSRADLRKTCG